MFEFPEDGEGLYSGVNDFPPGYCVELVHKNHCLLEWARRMILLNTYTAVDFCYGGFRSVVT